MVRNFAIVALILSLFTIPWLTNSPGDLFSEANATAQQEQKVRAGQLLVGFKPGISAAAYQAATSRNCVAVRDHIASLAVSLVEVLPGCDAAEVSLGMSAESAVAYVEPNLIAHAISAPVRFQRAASNILGLSANDPFFPQQYALAVINAPAGWDVFPGSFGAPAGVPIAIADTGADGTHPDISGKVLRSATFVEGPGPLVDDVGHGTATAGVALGTANNGFGIAGLAFNSPVVVVKVAESGTTTVFDIANGITYAADPAKGGAKVINLSFGASEPSDTLFRAIDFARTQGALMTIAAGNCGDGSSAGCDGVVNAMRWPAAYAPQLDNIIAVAASDGNDQRAYFSNFGNFVTVAAPGVDIISDFPLALSDNGVSTLSGTSFSAPYVAGLAGLLLSQNPSRSYQTVKALIQQSADKVGGQPYDASGRNDFFGFGRINVLRALQAGTPPPPPPPSGGVDAKIEVVFPHDQAGNLRPVTEAPLVNIQATMFQAGTLQPVPCSEAPTLQLWRSFNTQPAEMVAQAAAGVAVVDGIAFPSWEFNDVDVSAAHDPLNKYYFFLRSPGLQGFRSIVWSHGQDARTIFPTQDVPTSVDTQQPTGPLDGKIEIVFPHDAAGNPQPVLQATLVNIAVDVFDHGTLRSVPLDYPGAVRLLRSLNNQPAEVLGQGQRVTTTRGGVTYPQWQFNDVDVSAAQNPLNKYYFRVQLDFPNVWSHGADARTIFPQKDVPSASGAGCE